MKNFLYILLAVTLFSNCSKESRIHSCIDGHVIGERLPSGPSNATTNFYDWNAISFCYFSPEDSNFLNLHISTLNLRNCDSYSISINNIPRESKNITLALCSDPNKLSAEFTIIHGGDAVAEQYILDDDLPNYINFTKNRNYLLGEYTLNFIVSPESVGRGMYDPSLPNTLKFSHGIFKAPFIK